MRVLFASSRGAGHFTPLIPFARACIQAGHDVLFAGPPYLADQAEGAGFRFSVFDPPPEDELGAVWSRVPSLSPDDQNRVVIGEIFARLNAVAALPRLRELCGEWRPAVVVRDPAEYASAVAAEVNGIPHARVGIGLAMTEEMARPLYAGPVDELRRSAGLPADPQAEALRGSPYLTVFPASLEDPEHPDQPFTHRFRDPAWDASASALPDWWPGDERPLLYVTFGSVAGGMPMAAGAYGAVLEAAADLPVRVLLTVGREADPSSFADAPPNVHVESWVPQADVLAHAGAVICHGGSGSMLGALAAGVPQVVVPLFADQPYNAGRVAATGAGVVAPPEADAIRRAAREVLDDGSYRAGAERIAAEMRGHPEVDAAVEVLAVCARG